MLEARRRRKFVIVVSPQQMKTDVMMALNADECGMTKSF